MARKLLFDLQHISVARGTDVVLHDVSLQVEEGESIAILGPNGCGKSTLLKTLTSECYPIASPEMRVRILGCDRWDLTELRRRMGVVSADIPNNQMMKTCGFDAILTGFFSSSTLWPNLKVTQAMLDRAEKVLNMVGGNALREKQMGAMSAGQQRRIMIGRAIAGMAGDEIMMLLLDEPSNALDLAARQELREMLRILMEQGIAIILITHHVEDILPDMRRVVLMSEGKVIADGKKTDFLTAEQLTRLFGRPVVVEQDRGFYRAW